MSVTTSSDSVLSWIFLPDTGQAKPGVDGWLQCSGSAAPAGSGGAGESWGMGIGFSLCFLVWEDDLDLFDRVFTIQFVQPLNFIGRLDQIA